MGGRRSSARRVYAYGCSLDATGTFGSDEFSHSTNSSLNLLPAGAATHWPPMIGVATTLGNGPLPQARCPIGVSTSSVVIALASAALSLGLAAAWSAAARS